MAKKFGDINGEAKKADFEYFKFEDGKNKFRLVGEVLPRYVYWKKTPDDNKNIAIECLSFDRDEEKFTNTTKDWFQHYFPEDRCSWSYVVQVIDLEDKTVKVLGLKKKLFQQILEVANEHLGDPTDPEEGWDCVVTRKKNGPLPFNVEYTLDQLGSKKRPLTAEEKELIKDLKPIEELFPRPTPEQQKELIEKIWFSDEAKEEEEVPSEFNEEEDLPF